MNAKKFFSKVGLSYFMLAVLTIGVQLALSLIISAAAPQLFDISIVYWGISLIPLYLIAMPVCARMMKRLPAVRIYRSDMKPGQWLIRLCICMFVMYAGNIIGNLVSLLFSSLTGIDLTLAVEDMMMNESAWTTFLFSVVLAPILEELVFRKLLIDRTIVFGDRAAIVLSGFLFGLFHGNFYQLFYAFGLGCMLAYIYIRTGKIRYTISLHMAVNLIGGFFPTLFLKRLDLDAIQYGVDTQEVLRSMMGNLGTWVGLIFYEVAMIAVAVIGLVLFFLRLKKAELRPGQYSMPAGRTAGAMFGNVGMLLFIASCVVLFVIGMLP